jgi:hypothetical protein
MFEMTGSLAALTQQDHPAMTLGAALRLLLAEAERLCHWHPNPTTIQLNLAIRVPVHEASPRSMVPAQRLSPYNPPQDHLRQPHAVRDRRDQLRAGAVDVVPGQPDCGDDRRADRNRAGVTSALLVLPGNLPFHLAHANQHRRRRGESLPQGPRLSWPKIAWCPLIPTPGSMRSPGRRSSTARSTSRFARRATSPRFHHAREWNSPRQSMASWGPMYSCSGSPRCDGRPD